jgi:hypothetical protein
MGQFVWRAPFEFLLPKVFSVLTRRAVLFFKAESPS